MSLLNFPSNPTPGQLYTLGSTTYQWNGTAWVKFNTIQSGSQGTTVTNSLIVTTATNSVGTGSGALIVSGGASVGQDLYVGGIIYSGGQPVITTSNFSTVSAGVDIVVTTLPGGILEINNTSTLDSVTLRGNTTSNRILINNTDAAIGTDTGALVVAGGLGVGGSAYFGQTSYVNGAEIVTTATIGTATVPELYVGTDTAITTATGYWLLWNTSTLDSVTQRGSTTNQAISVDNTTSSTTTDTGAFVVKGGVGIAEDLNVGRDVRIVGSLTATNFLKDGIWPVSTGSGSLEFQYFSSNLGSAATINLESGLTGTVAANIVTLALDSASLSANVSNNINGGTTGSIAIQESPGKTAFIEPGSLGNLLQSNGNTATFVSTGSVYVWRSTAADTAIDVVGGAAGSLLIQSATNNTSHVPPGAPGELLQSGGTTATFVSTSNVYVGRAVLADSATTATTAETSLGVSNGNTGTILIQSAPGQTAFIEAGTQGQLLQSQGTTATFVNTNSLIVGFADKTNNIVGGTSGQLLYQSNTGVTTFSGPGNSGDLLTSNGTGGPTFISTSNVYVGLAILSNSANDVTGGTVGQLLIQANTGETSFVESGAAGQLLQSQGTTATFVNTSTLTVGFANRTNNIAGGTGGSLVYQSAADATTTLPIATTSGWLLRSTGSLPIWAPADGLVATDANNLTGGVAGSIPVQTSPDVTAFIAPGSAGQILQSQGTTATFVNTSGLQVGFADKAIDVLGGSTGSLVIQSGLDETSFVQPGAVGDILTYQTNTATFVSTSSIFVGLAAESDKADISNNIVGGTTGSIVIQSGIGETSFIQPGNNSDILTYQNNTATFISTSSIFVGLAAESNKAGVADDLSGGVAGSLVIQSNAGETSFVQPGTTGDLLSFQGSTATFISTSNIFVALAAEAGKANSADNITGGAAGFIPMQSAGGQTTFIAAGTAGQILQSNGTTATFVNTSSLQVEVATFATQIKVDGSPVAGSHYLTVVDSSASGNRLLYTTSTVVVDPINGKIGLGIVPISTLDVSGDTRITGLSTFTNVTQSISTTTGAVQIAGGVGVGGNVYTGGRVGFVNTSNVSRVYQYYNPVTDSLDTVFE